MRKLIQQSLQQVSRTWAFDRIVGFLESLEPQQGQLLHVLNYHRVDFDRPCSLFSSRVTVSPSVFEEQMEYLSAHCKVVSMSQVLEAFQGQGSLPPRSVLLTFDDAYRDFQERAWPILKRHGLPVTLFVPTAFPDQPRRRFWWDRLYASINCTSSRKSLETPKGRLSLQGPRQRREAFTRLRAYVKSLPNEEEAQGFVERVCQELGEPPSESGVLSWEALRALAWEGVTLGAHTRNHPIMTRISLEQARREATGSLHDLRQMTGPVPPVFAYPGGEYSEELVEALQGEGFALAFSTRRATNHLRKSHPLKLNRINVGPGTTLNALRAQLLTWPASFEQAAGSPCPSSFRP